MATSNGKVKPSFSGATTRDQPIYDLPVIAIERESPDATGYVEAVERLIGGLLRLHSPERICVVRIDNWFGPSWLRFSGKILGAAGVHDRDELRVPPFHPNRVRSQRTYAASGDSYKLIEAPALHIAQASSENLVLDRAVEAVAPNTALVWFSGNTASNGKGAMLVYVPETDGYWGWYCGFESEDGWRRTRLAGIDQIELDQLRAPG